MSLEGLAEHNDHIRGPGHFARTLEFLKALKDLGVYSMVMLTMTRDNQDQVLPLGRLLAGLANEFNFNRLSPCGQGASLLMPDRQGFPDFLEQYLDEARGNPVLFLKDSLFNLVRRRAGEGLIGGCTGYGCGAACRDCPLTLVCGGCLASTHGHGLDIFTERDPFCFREEG